MTCHLECLLSFELGDFLLQNRNMLSQLAVRCLAMPDYSGLAGAPRPGEFFALLLWLAQARIRFLFSAGLQTACAGTGLLQPGITLGFIAIPGMCRLNTSRSTASKRCPQVDSARTTREAARPSERTRRGRGTVPPCGAL